MSGQSSRRGFDTLPTEGTLPNYGQALRQLKHTEELIEQRKKQMRVMSGRRGAAGLSTRESTGSKCSSRPERTGGEWQKAFNSSGGRRESACCNCIKRGRSLGRRISSTGRRGD